MISATEIDGVNAALAADEEGLFSSEFSNVALAGNNISLEMLQLATEVYGPDRADFLSHDPLVWENPSGNNTGAKVAIAPQTRGWHPVAASELGMASEEQSNPLKYSFVGGHYQAIDTNKSVPITGDYAEANALVLTGLVHDPVSGTDKRTLALIVRGTDQVADAYFDFQDFQSHYAKFAPLVQAIHHYLTDPAAGIQQVLISGHSLGAGVVPYFMQSFPNTASYAVRAYVDGPPGSEVDAGDSRIVNFVHAGQIFPAADDHRGDAVVIVGEVSHSDDTNIGGGLVDKAIVEGIMDVLSPSGIDPKTQVGSDILIDSDVPQDLPIVSWVYGQGLFGPQHNSNLYAADLAKLVRFANDDNSPFAWTDASKTQHSALASALRSGTVYEGSSVAIAVGQPAKAELQALLDPKSSSNADTNFVDPAVYVGQAYAQNINVYWRDDYVLSEANGIIHWDQPWIWSLFDGYTFNPAEHVHVVDGGSTAAPSLVVLQGSSTDYRFTTKMTDLGLEADLKWVDSDSNEHLIGQLYRTNPLLFLPTTTSSSATGSDATSPGEPQFMVHLDGSTVTVQTTLAGQASLTVDPSFDYADAGDENLTITGSGLGDIIALGSGNNTVIETTGNNIIFVKDPSTAGSNTIHGGVGYDTIVGGQGNDKLFGGSGKDIINGNGGNDFLFGGTFNPDGSFAANSGDDDILEGGDGNDGLWGADGNDHLLGGLGSDGLLGGAGNDLLDGGDGADFLFGGDFSIVNGSLLPNSGNDTLNGGNGNDGLWGFDGMTRSTATPGDDYAEGGLRQ